MRTGTSEFLPDRDGPSGSWQKCLQAGRQYLAAGQPRAALPHLLAANRLRPGQFIVLQALAAAYLRAGQPDHALACFDQLLSLDPANWRALHGRGLAQHARGDRSAALGAFRRSVGSSPDAWEAWGSIADITPDEDERVCAIAYRADALLRRCGSGQASPRDYSDCVRSLLDARRGHEAVEFIGRNTARFHDRSTAHDWLARASYETGDYREALRQKQYALSPGQHGLADGPSSPSFSPDAAARALCGIGKILEAAGISWFLAAGTLLGFYRDGAPLAHDRDVDIGVLADAVGGPDLAGVIREHPALLLDRRARPGDRYFPLTFEGIAVDIFLYEPGDGALHCGLGRLVGDVAWRFTSFGLKAADFQGQTCNIPDDPDRYLDETYGYGWQMPDTGYASALSSPALCDVDPYVRAYYALARALKARLSGDEAKVRALLRQSPVRVGLPDLAAGGVPPAGAGLETNFHATENGEEDA